MEFNEFRNKVKEALPDFLTDDLRNAEIKDTAVNKLQGESYSGISVTPEGSRVGVSINLEDAFLDYQTGSQFTAVMNRLLRSFSLRLRRKSVRNERAAIIEDDENEGIGDASPTSRMTGKCRRAVNGMSRVVPLCPAC